MVISPAIYARELQNRVLQEQCNVRVNVHFGGDSVSRILLSREHHKNKSLARENELVYECKLIVIVLLRRSRDVTLCNTTARR